MRNKKNVYFWKRVRRFKRTLFVFMRAAKAARMRWKCRATTQGRPYGFTVFVIIFRDDVGIVPYTVTNRSYNKYFANHHFQFSILHLITPHLVCGRLPPLLSLPFLQTQLALHQPIYVQACTFRPPHG